MPTALAAPDRPGRVDSKALHSYQMIAATSITPNATQQIAFPRCSANQYPLAALKHKTALVHPLAHAVGLLIIFRSFIAIWEVPRQQ